MSECDGGTEGRAIGEEREGGESGQRRQSGGGEEEEETPLEHMGRREEENRTVPRGPKGRRAET